LGELAFIGLGLGDERDLSRRAMDRLNEARVVFAEEYTSQLSSGSVDRLAAEVGRPVIVLDRAALEAQTIVLDALAEGGRVVLLVVGDPFAATTHVALRIAAERKGHSWSYLPNASIHTAAASFLGLMHYRFGRTVSLPFDEPGFAPRSFLDVISANSSSNSHTLVLLDLRPSEGRFMTADRGLGLLRERDPEGAILPPHREVAVVARIGTDQAEAWVGSSDALSTLDFGPPLHAIVVPAPELHFQENEALERFRRGKAPV
jgi:diphthine synthase